MASVLSRPEVGIVMGFILLLIHIIKKIRVIKNLIWAIIAWIMVNLIAVLFSGNYDFSLITPRVVRGLFIFILLPYLSLNIIGFTFWDKLEKIVFYLTVVSLPLFLLNSLFYDNFNAFKSIFHPLTSHSFLIFESDRPYWSALLYTNASKEGTEYIRNSGFMWEPGAFAMMIIWALVYTDITSSCSVKKRIIYILALATTFSTAGYLAFFVLLISNYFKKNTSLLKVLVVSITLFMFYFYIYDLEFMSKKIEYYATAYEENKLIYSPTYELIKVNRLQSLYYILQDLIKFPLGKGRVLNTDFSSQPIIYGTNGLGHLLVMWGIPIFIYMMILVKRYLTIYNFSNTSNHRLIFLMIAMLIMFFSNPIEKNVFIYLILFSPLIFRPNNIRN